MTTRLALAAFPLCLAVFAEPCNAQVYKCQDAAGKTVYADAPCAQGGKPMALPNAAKDGTSNPTACNLLDETRRLAADAKRGNSASAARRKTLMAEYQHRCAGISKSSK